MSLSRTLCSIRLLKENEQITKKFKRYPGEYYRITVAEITYFEILAVRQRTSLSVEFRFNFSI